MQHTNDWRSLYLWITLGLLAAPVAFYSLVFYVTAL